MAKRKIKARAAPANLPAPGGAAPPATADYKVGYRRPPDRTRFAKGRSGNPNGRPQGSASAKTIVSRVIGEKVTLRDGDKARDVTKLEGLLQAHLVKAIKGDARSASLVIGLVAKLGLFADTEKEPFRTLSEEDQAILEDYVRSQTGSAAAKTENGLEN
jgi:hypothetical protein